MPICEAHILNLRFKLLGWNLIKITILCESQCKLSLALRHNIKAYALILENSSAKP